MYNMACVCILLRLYFLRLYFTPTDILQILLEFFILLQQHVCGSVYDCYIRQQWHVFPNLFVSSPFLCFLIPLPSRPDETINTLAVSFTSLRVRSQSSGIPTQSLSQLFPKLYATVFLIHPTPFNL